MFAYCQNNPANYFDPSGNAAVVVCHVDESIPFGGGLGFSGIGGGGGVGGSVVVTIGVIIYVVITDPFERPTAKSQAYLVWRYA